MVVNRNDEDGTCRRGDRHHVPRRIVGQHFLQQRAHGNHRSGSIKQGVVVSGVRKRAATDDSVGARLVLDDDRLAPAPGEPVGIERALTSLADPAANGTMIFTARAGQSSPPRHIDVVPAEAPTRAIVNAMTCRRCRDRRSIGFLQTAHPPNACEFRPRCRETIDTGSPS